MHISIISLLVLEACGSIFFVCSVHFKQYVSILYVCIPHKIIQNYIAISFKIIRRKKICVFSQAFTFKHKINKSDTEISVYY